MRSFLRRAGLILALGSLVFFLSCERHEVGELPLEEHAKASKKEHATTTHTPDAATPAHDAATHVHGASTSPAATSTPANFFPDKPKP
jgi:hypothetical protein